MAGSLKLDGSEFLVKEGGQFKITNSELKLKSSGNTVVDSSGNAVLSESGGNVSIGNLRLPATGGIKDSSGNNILTESGGNVSISNASVGIKKVTSSVNSSNAYNSGELVAIVDGSGNPTGQVFVHDGSTNGGSLVNKTLLKYWTNNGTRNYGSHSDNVNESFNVNSVDINITPSPGSTHFQMKFGAEVVFYQGWNGGGWGGTGTTGRIQIDNTTVQTDEWSSGGYTGNYMGTSPYRVMEHIHDSTSGAAFNVKFYIPSNSSVVGSTWYIVTIGYEIFEWGGSWGSDSTLYIRPGV